ncbi:MAG: ribosome small subunit-dependent GTPase A [Spirochaetes bacterium]|nr:ribosome small subunit-dependent GTPase A [Spirochaetota bacterium]
MTNNVWSASGWDAIWQEQFDASSEPHAVPGRIIAAFGTRYLVATREGERPAFETGQLRYLAELGAQPAPVTGDFVSLSGGGPGEAAITRVLARRSLFARKRPGSSRRQPLVANLDLLVIVTDPGGDFSVRRVERYVEALASGCDAPVVLAVNKADTVDDAATRAAEARLAISGLDAVAISARTGQGIPELRSRWASGDTVVLAGSSGVGKSTLVNVLCGTAAETGDLRGDGRGMHKTTTRRAYVTDDGAFLVDTPGLREVGLYSEDGSAGTAFPEIVELEDQCRFRDCRHEEEPGCAVRAAVESGEIDRGRYESFLALRTEAETTAAEARERKRRWEKEIAKEIRRFRKRSDKQ